MNWNYYNSSLVPIPADCDLLVELHDALEPRLSDELRGCVKSTHEVELINSQDRVPRAYPNLQPLSRVNQKVAVSELRDGVMLWAFMRSRELRSR